MARAHQADVDMLIGERERVLRDYQVQITALGPGRGLIGAQGALPEDAQRMLLALSARPRLARPVFAVLARVFAAVRAAGRLAGGRR
jgi:hypothetical protein